MTAGAFAVLSVSGGLKSQDPSCLQSFCVLVEMPRAESRIIAHCIIQRPCVQNAPPPPPTLMPPSRHGIPAVSICCVELWNASPWSCCSSQKDQGRTVRTGGRLADYRDDLSFTFLGGFCNCVMPLDGGVARCCGALCNGDRQGGPYRPT